MKSQLCSGHQLIATDPCIPHQPSAGLTDRSAMVTFRAGRPPIPLMHTPSGSSGGRGVRQGRPGHTAAHTDRWKVRLSDFLGFRILV